MEKIVDELVLWFLRQGHPQQFEFRWRWTLPDIVCEAGVTAETQVKVPEGNSVERTVVHTLKPKRVNGFHFVALCPQCHNEPPRQVLVEQNPHAGCGCCC